MSTELDQKLGHHYDAAFYGSQREKSRHGADRILPLVVGPLAVNSVVDFGCGVGTWLAAALALGVERARGIEGPWVDSANLADPRIDLVNQNLEQRVDAGEGFDLAMSLEVAEHLSADRAPTFVEDLCRASRRVLFGAAVPGQGGENHINEQWPSYWVALFAAHGYLPLDVVRTQLWGDATIPLHYRQNLLLYVHRSELDAVKACFPAGVGEPPRMLDVIQPELWLRDTVNRLPMNLKDRLVAAAGIPGALMRTLGRRIGG